MSRSELCKLAPLSGFLLLRFESDDARLWIPRESRLHSELAWLREKKFPDYSQTLRISKMIVVNKDILEPINLVKILDIDTRVR